MFVLESLVYTYPGHGAALRGLSAAIPRGLTIVAGPNAGGKTTLLKMLAGLINPESGRITPAGGSAGLSSAERRRLTRMVMQDADPQILGARVGEDIMLGQAASSLPRERFAAEAERLAEEFGLGGLWDREVDSLSYGQKRKLCLLHALAAGPQVLLLDEPFAGLDYPSARELRRHIGDNHRSGLTQVVCTHEVEPVFDLADWVVVVEAGRAVATGRPGDVAGILAAHSVRPPGGGWD